MIVTTARTKTHARPTSREVIWAISEKSLLTGGHPLTQSMALTWLWPDPFAFGLLPFAMCVCSRWTGLSKECSMLRKVPWCLGSDRFLQGSKTRIGLLRPNSSVVTYRSPSTSTIGESRISEAGSDRQYSPAFDVAHVGDLAEALHDGVAGVQ
jgi:hypothetical protein